MKAGHYYSSSGPELHEVALDGDELVVEGSPARVVIAQGAGSAAKHVRAAASELGSARLPLASFRKGGWVRATLVDMDGRKAWSNPIWLS